MGKLFGTDGIRGAAGIFPLDEATVRVIGRSLARIYSEKLGRKPRFILGRDTRVSGESIERAISAGAASIGAECTSAGVMTTPGVAFLTAAGDFDAGVVISASHNPFEDNGIKIFTPNGTKADKTLESAIERDVEAANSAEPMSDDESAENVADVEGFKRMYQDHLISHFPGLDLKGKRLVVDCANGAASAIAPDVFGRIGAEVIAINDAPDGRNINKDCGSLHLDVLQRAVSEHGADVGIAFDGDADRCLFVDDKGAIVDGDATLWIIGGHLLDHGGLQNRRVVATVMSNIGLELAFRDRGVELVRTAVGDKYVLEELIDSGSEIGGEQSGHVIFPEISLVGDGILTALLLLETLVEKGASLSQLLSGFQTFPQILVNVKVASKTPFDEVDEIAELAKEIESDLDGSGRLLLRYSGTENLARVMIEGRDHAEITEKANRLADVIRRTLG